MWAGSINDATLPTTPGVVQPSFHGGSGAFGDGLIAKIAGFPAVAAKAGDSVELFGVGFGTTNRLCWLVRHFRARRQPPTRGRSGRTA